MSKRKTAVQPEREQAIGARLREARERLRYSRPEFASSLGLTADQLRFIECGRTRLPYAIAWLLRESYRVSLDWISGEGQLGGKDILPWPSPNTAETPASAYFSEVLDRLLAAEQCELRQEPVSLEGFDAELDAKAAAMTKLLWRGDNPDAPCGQAGFPVHIIRRDWARQILFHDVESELASLTPDSIEGFADGLRSALRQLAAKFPHLPREVAEENAREMEAIRLRDEAPAPKPPPEAPAEPPVKAPLPARRRRAPRA